MNLAILKFFLSKDIIKKSESPKDVFIVHKIIKSSYRLRRKRHTTKLELCTNMWYLKKENKYMKNAHQIVEPQNKTTTRYHTSIRLASLKKSIKFWCG